MSSGRSAIIVGMPAYVISKVEMLDESQGQRYRSLPRPPSIDATAGTSFVEPSQRYRR
jgi:uncharacterized protein (DUF1330 family)